MSFLPVLMASRVFLGVAVTVVTLAAALSGTYVQKKVEAHLQVSPPHCCSRTLLRSTQPTGLLTIASAVPCSAVRVALLQEDVIEQVKRVVDEEEKAEQLQQLRQQHERAVAMRDGRWSGDGLSSSSSSRGNLPPSPAASRADMR